MKVPTINLQDADANERLVQSLRDTGFAVITNHGIPASVFEDCYKAWAGFFQHPTYKTRFTFKKETQSGFFPIKSEKAKGATVADIKEFFHYFGNNPTISEQLPALPLNLRRVTAEAFISLEALSVKLLNTLERATPIGVNKCDRQWAERGHRLLEHIIPYSPLPAARSGCRKRCSTGSGTRRYQFPDFTPCGYAALPRSARQLRSVARNRDHRR